MSSSDSYKSLVDLDKPNAIECPICLEECNDDDKTCKKEKNKAFKCKHAVCRDCYNRLNNKNHINAQYVEKNIASLQWTL